MKKRAEREKKPKNNFLGTMNKAIKMELREHKSSFLVYVILRIVVIAVMVLQLLNGNYENVFLCILTLLLLIVPSFLQVNLRIEIPTPLEITILLFIFAAEILGEIREYYIIYPYWDTMLHTVNGFLAAAIGFSLVDILNRNERFAIQLSPAFVAIVAFCFSMTIGVLWEFFECGMDLFFKLDMQKDTVIHSLSTVMLDPNGGNKPTILKDITAVTVNGQELGVGGYLDIGLLDTMKDLFVNFVGAVIFSFLGYFYVKKRGQGKFAKEFIPTIKEDDADFLTIVTEEEEHKEKEHKEKEDKEKEDKEKEEKEHKEKEEEKKIKVDKKIKTVIFDIGNVLVDFCYRDCFKAKIADEEVLEKVIKATVKSDTWQELDKGVWSEEEILESFVSHDRSVEKEIRMLFSDFGGILRKREESIPWIKQLKENGYQVLYLSNFPHKMTRECKETLDFIEFTDGGILSYLEKCIKPYPEIYQKLMERYELVPEECVFIDDSKNNIEAAKKLGMHGIVFVTREQVLEELKELGVQ